MTIEFLELLGSSLLSWRSYLPNSSKRRLDLLLAGATVLSMTASAGARATQLNTAAQWLSHLPVILCGKHARHAHHPYA